MAIFNKSVDDLSFGDLKDLLEGASVENVLLEFKKEAPGRDETLKKLSAFANTFGGHMVVGAAANSETGVLEDLPGIEAVAGYKQKVVSWCLGQVTPPVTVMVSAPIPVPGTDRVCYVVYVPLSLTAPHFLVARRSPLDDIIEFSVETEARVLQDSEEDLAKELMISLLFALNWADAIELNSLRGLTKWAYEFNGWKPPVGT